MTDVSDLEFRAVNALAKRRRDPKLAVGFSLACGAVLDLFGWNSATDDDGETTWRPAAAGPGVRAKIHLSDGGSVDIRAGKLVEMHLTAGMLAARLRLLATERGIGQTPAPDAYSRRPAACACCWEMLGAQDDAVIDQLVDDPEIDALFFNTEA